MADNDFRDEFPSMQEAFGQLTDSLSGYLAELEDLPALDNRTKELVRLTCTTILRHGPGVRRHAMLAAEFGASWEDVLGVLVLTQPSFGLVPAREMLPFAREGYEDGAGAGSD
jgi:alkylhydroperoxidase/carboxymuconolactone decarboxylase family protein YurZ